MSSPWLQWDWKSKKNILVGKHKSYLEKGERGHQTLHASNMNLTTSDMPSGEAVPHLSPSKMLTMKDKRKSFFCHLNVLKMVKIAEFTLTEAGSWRVPTAVSLYVAKVHV